MVLVARTVVDAVARNVSVSVTVTVLLFGEKLVSVATPAQEF